MKRMSILKIFYFLLLSLLTSTSFAWDRSLELGYGYSHDPNNSRYNNSGFLLSGDFWPLWRTPITFWTLNGAIGQWHATAPTHQSLTTGAVALALRVYPMCSDTAYPLYLLGSAGPAYLSDNQFGKNKQGSNFTFQFFGGLGVEHNHFDANLRLVHYSNARLASPDQGFTILYLLSLGYLF